MADINITRDSKLINVLAAQANNERLDSNVVAEASAICDELVKDLNPTNRHMIAQTVAYTVDNLQQKSLDFLNQVADVKNIAYGDKAVFRFRTGGIHAFIQAKGGSTTARSYVSDRQVTLDTVEISARPAINIYDLRTGKVNMADLIREANAEMTNAKLLKVEQVLHDAIDDYASPFYATGTGIVKATLDSQLVYFDGLGPVTILGDRSAVAQLNAITGFTGNAGTVVQSDDMMNEMNANGFIGRYNGRAVVAMQNGYLEGTTTPVLNRNWLYILPGGLSADQRNLKVLNEGAVNAFESQNIDDLVYEIRLDQTFGAGFVSGKLPTIGAYKIG